MDNGNNKYKITFGIILLLASVTFIAFGIMKSGYFIDEIYTYGLSNSYYTPFIKNINSDDGIIADTILTKEDFNDYVTVSGDDAFKFDSVYYNQTQDVHPPLYYFLIHLASSFGSGGELSQWTGLVLNLIIFISLLILLNKLTYEVTASKAASVFCIILYGFSIGAMSTAIMIRMYILLTMLTVLLTLFTVKFLKNQKWYYFIGIGVSIYLGLFTQYYFVIYAFFLCACVVFLLLKDKKIKKLLIFCAVSIGSVLLFYVSYPACLKHLFSDKLVSGNNAVDNILNINEYVGRLYTYLTELIRNMPVVFILFFICVILFIFRCRKIFRKIKENINIGFIILAIMISSVFTLIVTAIISPVYSIRYIYNIMPILVLCVICLYQYVSAVFNIERFTYKVAIGTGVLSLVTLIVIKPDYLYLENKAIDQKVEVYCDNSCCIYFDDNYNAPLTSDLIQIMKFDEIYVSNDTGSAKMLRYIENKNTENMVVYIDVSEFWSSGYDSGKILDDLIKNTEYNSYTELYKKGLSETYVLKK